MRPIFLVALLAAAVGAELGVEEQRNENDAINEVKDSLKDSLIEGSVRNFGNNAYIPECCKNRCGSTKEGYRRSLSSAEVDSSCLDCRACFPSRRTAAAPSFCSQHPNDPSCRTPTVPGNLFPGVVYYLVVVVIPAGVPISGPFFPGDPHFPDGTNPPGYPYPPDGSYPPGYPYPPGGTYPRGYPYPPDGSYPPSYPYPPDGTDPPGYPYPPGGKKGGNGKKGKNLPSSPSPYPHGNGPPMCPCGQPVLNCDGDDHTCHYACDKDCGDYDDANKNPGDNDDEKNRGDNKDHENNGDYGVEPCCLEREVHCTPQFDEFSTYTGRKCQSYCKTHCRSAKPPSDNSGGYGGSSGGSNSVGSYSGGKKGGGKKGDSKTGDDKKGDDKKGDSKKGDDKKGDSKKGDSKKGDSKKGDSKKGDDRKGDDKKGDSKKGDSKKGDSKKGDRGMMEASGKMPGGRGPGSGGTYRMAM